MVAQIAAAHPGECRLNVIIAGSLATGYHFFAGDGQRSNRAKNVDFMFSSHAMAVATARRVTERLLQTPQQLLKVQAELLEKLLF